MKPFFTWMYQDKVAAAKYYTDANNIMQDFSFLFSQFCEIPANGVPSISALT